MPLHPQVKAALDAMTAAGPPLHRLTPQEARKAIEAMRATRGEPERVAKIENVTFRGPGGPLPARIYIPDGRGPFPVLLYFHGGGWVVGSIETVDASCRSLANQAGCIVISADYRLAPEHKFPAAAEDAYAAAQWTALNIASFYGDPARLAVGGESAGANLAAVAAIMAQERGTPSFVLQLLLYPALNYAFDTPSCKENAEGYFLTTEMMQWFWKQYLTTDADGENPYASPLRVKRLQGMAPAAIFTAEFDPLRDDGAAYAAKLREAGIPVTYKCQEGLIHGYMGMASAVEPAKKARDEAAAALRAAFAK
ncbi:MAG TPA: alpha/beta hydrolase fold domain-containing protein [Methylomirabilota bacterium]|nr:alpha/beta hydrolase fold domain-containing protein [Methylomirabilota bacterium]